MGPRNFGAEGDGMMGDMEGMMDVSMGWWLVVLLVVLLGILVGNEERVARAT